MRIDGTNPWAAMEGLASEKAPGAESSTASQSAASTVTGDEAQVSYEGSLVSRLYQRLDAVPDVRQAKVQELQKSIAQGSYTVSADQIATAMQNDLRGFPVRR